MILCLKMELYAIPGATQDATQGATQAPTAKLAKLTLSLIYAGDESSIKNGEKYWTNNPINNNSLQQFNTISLAIGFDEFKTIFGMKKEHYKFSVVNILETYKTLNLYIVRHGYSYHNQKWYEKNPLKSDTNLITLPPVIRELIDKFLKKNYDVKEKYIVKEYLVNYFSNNNNNNNNNVKEFVDTLGNELYHSIEKENKILKRTDLNKVLSDTLGNLLGCAILGEINSDFNECNSKFTELAKLIGPSRDNEDRLSYILRALSDPKNEALKDDVKTKIENLDNEILLSNILSNIVINKNGEFQSIQAGRFFSARFVNKSLNAVFVSDLERTQETASFFLSQLNTQQFNRQTTPIIVLPCLHELSKDEKDGSWTNNTYSALVVFNRENKRRCIDDEKANFFTKNCSYITLSKNEHNENPQSLKINWSFYKDFYGKGYRGDVSRGNREHCRDTHFIGIFLYYLSDGKIKVKSPNTVINNDNNNNPYTDVNNEKDITGQFLTPGYNKNVVVSNNVFPFEGGKTKRKRVSVNNKRRTKKNYKSKSKKVRKIRRVNKSKKGKKRATRHK